MHMQAIYTATYLTLSVYIVLFVILASPIAVTVIAHNQTNHQFIALLKLPLNQQGSTETPLPISDTYHREKCVGLNPNIYTLHF